MLRKNFEGQVLPISDLSEGCIVITDERYVSKVESGKKENLPFVRTFSVQERVSKESEVFIADKYGTETPVSPSTRVFVVYEKRL